MRPMYRGCVPAEAAQGLNPKPRGLVLNETMKMAKTNVLKNIFKYQSTEQIEFNHMLEHQLKLGN